MPVLSGVGFGAVRIGLVLLLMAGCRTVKPEAGPTPQDPFVDAACLDRARAGSLLPSLPSQLGAFEVSISGDTVRLHRPGRAFTESEGRALWEQLGERRRPRGLSMGHSAISSVYKCPGVADGGCLTFALHLCQTSLAELVGTLEQAATDVNASDAELLVSLTIHEVGGPKCKDGARCRPAAHYSTQDEPYRATRLRTAIPRWSRGACRDDGDCESGGNTCHAWYQRGGVELLIFIQHSEPTFCGCLANRCTWFTQE